MAILKAHELDKQNTLVLAAACEILSSTNMRKPLAEILDQIPQHHQERRRLCALAGMKRIEHFGYSRHACDTVLAATEAQPGLAEPFFMLGRTLSLVGRSEEAIAALKKGFEFVPADDSGRRSTCAAFILAECYQTTGAENLARDWLHAALKRARILRNYYLPQGLFWEARVLWKLNEGKDIVYRPAS